jgi:hypothetical protein
MSRPWLKEKVIVCPTVPKKTQTPLLYDISFAFPLLIYLLITIWPRRQVNPRVRGQREFISPETKVVVMESVMEIKGVAVVTWAYIRQS